MAREKAPRPTLRSPLLGLPGVGPRTAERLAKGGLATRADALMLFPRRWDDLRATTRIADLVDGAAHTVRARVVSCRVVFGRKRFLEAQLVDEHEPAPKLLARWFRFRGSLRERFSPGACFLLSGTARLHQGKMQMVHPESVAISSSGEAQEAGPGDDGDDADEEQGAGIRVRYPEMAGVGGTLLARVCRNAAEAHAGELLDPLPLPLRARLGLPSLSEAIAALHCVPLDAPPERIDALNQGRSPEQERLAFDELFFYQLALLVRRAAVSRRGAAPCPTDPATLERFFSSLPFSPTGAQRRATDEIAADLRRPHPMRRLLQGDVGSGKTVVLYAAAELAMAAGRQVAVMAPTELLAEQHAETLGRFAASTGRRVALLTAATPRATAERTRARLEEGAIDLLVGTHALIAERVRFARLGLCVVDEQHRFGVAQRAALAKKSADSVEPHLLVMTATPIPRTLALTAYGDLDVTVLDELPPGRSPPTTELHSGAQARARAYATLERAVGDGRQAYVVCPRVHADYATDGDDQDAAVDRLGDGDGDEALDDVQSAIATCERLSARLDDVGLLHGRMPAVEREQVMRRFREGALRVLVATTVIEVGVDVPRADLMLIEGAERYGLSQLHQLRGRIGRAGGRSLCMLVTDGKKVGGDDAGRRLEVLLRESDGFRIAEEDLLMRGPGELIGTRQAGLPRLRSADLARHQALLERAREHAAALLLRDPELALPEHAATRDELSTRARDDAYGEEAG